MHTLFPDPVEPAISMCGIVLRSATIAFPAMSFPTANVIFDSDFLNAAESMISLAVTMLILSFSISMPTAGFPGIGASILMLLASMLSAISSARFFMPLTFTPLFGWTSYLVTVGPCVTLVTCASMLKLCSVSSSFIAFALRMFSSSAAFPFDLFALFKRSIGGNL